jgi:uridylate kinase
MKRFLLLAVGTVIGVLVGAWYGWYGNPSTYTETSPDQLRAEYRADYVLMVAEIYAADHDIGAAAVRLSRLGRADLADMVREIANAYAAAGYPEEDLAKLNDLARDLARYSTLPTAAAP